ncbi:MULTISPECIES: MafI family immunity protein [unclassified Paenibacillus]|uniref:MafI family immunity protein n=1 Tax=unclassified Paenibacillus TaxID=185978 RepID=UPI003624E6B5
MVCQSKLELLEHNEWGIALENLCATIFEENLPISVFIYTEIKCVGEVMEMDSSIWKF